MMPSKVIDYNKYGLECNPFVSETHDYPLAGMKDLIRDIQVNVNSVLKARGVFYYVIFGRYGEGKTRILFELSKLFNDLKFTGGLKVLTSLYPIRALPPKPPTRYFAKHLLPQVIRSNGVTVFRKLRKELDNPSTSHTKGSASLLANLDPDFRNAFLAIDGAQEEKAFAWLTGTALAAGAKKDINVTENITIDDKAEKVFLSLLKLLWTLEYKALVLLIDEFEYVTYMGKRCIEFIETYRSLYENVNDEVTIHKDIASLIAIFACTPDAWETLEKMRIAGSEPFLERIPEENKINLKPLSPDETRFLIESRLNKHRLSKAKLSHLDPFEKDYPSFVCDKSGGRPRGIRSFSRVVIDDALLMNKGSVSTELAEGILLDRGYIIKPKVSEMPELRKAKERVRPKVERRFVPE